MASFPPKLGFGVGLRRKHYSELFGEHGAALSKRVDWFEVISENFMVEGGKPLEILARARATHPIVTHGVSLSIGSADPLNERHLADLKTLAARVEPAMISDHLCWGSIDGRYAHDLLPLPYSEPEIARIADKVSRVQDALKRRILIENVSSYLTWRHSTMPEWEFLAAVAERADCGILFDVNNVYVSARNHGFDPMDYLRGIPVARVGQFHLAGHSDYGRYVIDTHDGPVIPPVWELYRAAVERFGTDVPTLIEWDDKIPSFAELADEADRARKISVQAGRLRPVGGPGAKPLETVETHGVGVAQTQRVFWNLITAPEGAATAPEAKRIDELIVGDDLSAVTRAEIYANAYFGRLKDALLEDFPAVAAAAGEVDFHNLVTDFLLAHPSSNPSLRWLGRPFPAFLRAHALGARVPWLADLAALEWARVDAFDAAEAPLLATDDLAGIAPDRWESLRFRAHPSLKLVATAWRVDEPWAQVDREEAPDAPAREDGGFRVWRQDSRVWHAWMEPAERAALERLAAGESFGAVCAEATAALGGDAQAAATSVLGWLRAWLDDGLLSELAPAGALTAASS